MKKSEFKPAWWLPFSHMQTIWPAFIKRRDLEGVKELSYERLELPDGDFLDLVWSGRDEKGPIVIMLHGFEGSIDSHYSKGMLIALKKYGLRSVFMHFRGCSGTHNRLPKNYHSGDTEDIAHLAAVLKKREPKTKLAAIGYSLGGNVLLKWLGETGKENPLESAIAVSVPFELTNAVNRIQRGFSRLYHWYLLNHVCRRLQAKFKHIESYAAHFTIEQIKTIKSIVEFDDMVTAKLHGFENAHHYYNSASSRQYLKNIKVPTLIVHAKDDPFMTPEAIPSQSELSPYVQLEVSEKGGHVGFISGGTPWKPTFWIEERAPQFFVQYFQDEELSINREENFQPVEADI